jgi:hypothetical protein
MRDPLEVMNTTFFYPFTAYYVHRIGPADFLSRLKTSTETCSKAAVGGCGSHGLVVCRCTR